MTYIDCDMADNSGVMWESDVFALVMNAICCSASFAVQLIIYYESALDIDLYRGRSWGHARRPNSVRVSYSLRWQ